MLVMCYIVLFLCRYYPERPAIGEYDRELNNYRYTTSVVNGGIRESSIHVYCVVLGRGKCIVFFQFQVEYNRGS